MKFVKRKNGLKITLLVIILLYHLNGSSITHIPVTVERMHFFNLSHSHYRSHSYLLQTNPPFLLKLHRNVMFVSITKFHSKPGCH